MNPEYMQKKKASICLKKCRNYPKGAQRSVWGSGQHQNEEGQGWGWGAGARARNLHRHRARKGAVLFQQHSCDLETGQSHCLNTFIIF